MARGNIDNSLCPPGVTCSNRKSALLFDDADVDAKVALSKL
jgi:hypothetical protein